MNSDYKIQCEEALFYPSNNNTINEVIKTRKFESN